MEKETAIQWLKKQLQMNKLHKIKDRKEAFEKALQMEKEQIIKAFDNGRNAPSNYVGEGSQYFYETYEI